MLLSDQAAGRLLLLSLRARAPVAVIRTGDAARPADARNPARSHRARASARRSPDVQLRPSGRFRPTGELSAPWRHFATTNEPGKHASQTVIWKLCTRWKGNTRRTCECSIYCGVPTLSPQEPARRSRQARKSPADDNAAPREASSCGQRAREVHKIRDSRNWSTIDDQSCYIM